MAQAPKELPSQNRLAISGAEIILLVFLLMLGMGLWVWMERAFSAFFSQPNEQEFLNTQRINEKQEELARLEALRKDTEHQLLVAEVDQLKQHATMKSLETLHPGIDKLQQGASVPAEAVKTYESARAQELAAGELIKLLNARIEKSKTDSYRVTEELKPQKESGTNGFQWAQTKYVWKKAAALFLLPSVLILLLLFVVRGVVRGEVWTNQGSVLSLVVVGALVILFAHQAFQLTGAVLVGTILFLFLLRKIKWSPRGGVEHDTGGG